MDSKSTTALVPYDDQAPTIEFRIPLTDESYTEEPMSAAAAINHSYSRSAPLQFLRKIPAVLLIGITVISYFICAGHILGQSVFRNEDIPAVLLNLLSVGEVHTIPAKSPVKLSTASPSDPPLSPLTTPSETQILREKEPLTLTFTNETPYTPDPNAILSQERTIAPLDELHAVYGADSPTVLILSTHGTEAYAENEDAGYRTSDDSENIIRVSAAIAQGLEKAGIGVIHCLTKFDEEDFTLAYYNASLEIRKQLNAHPSIRYVIDIHRDSVQNADGTYLALESDGLAQLMFVVGTDHGGSGHTGWENNLALAARLYTDLEVQNPGLMRPVNIRSASFNQQYTEGSLILEVGSCAGSLDSAMKSAELFAEALAKEIIG